MMHYDGRKSIATIHMSDSDNLNFREKTLLNFKAFLCREAKSDNVLFFNKTIVGFDGILKIWKFFFFIFEIHKPSATKKLCFYNLLTFIFIMLCDIKLIYLNATCGRHMIKSWYSLHGEINNFIKGEQCWIYIPYNIYNKLLWRKYN